MLLLLAGFGMIALTVAIHTLGATLWLTNGGVALPDGEGMNLFYSVAAGLIVGVLIGKITEYYTADRSTMALARGGKVVVGKAHSIGRQDIGQRMLGRVAGT